MDLFARQEAVRRRSRWLLVLFALAVVAIVLAVDVAVLLALAASGGLKAGSVAGILAMTTVATLLLIGGASLYRTMSLRKGGAAVALAMGGTLVPPDVQEPGLRRLRNVVEEMAIAAGTSVPQVFVLEDETRINAFAAGFGRADAAIAVTRGALDRLNRSELQGVVAHEFGHIVNGDIRLNLRLVGVLFGIVMLGIVGRHLLGQRRVARDGRREGAGLVFVGLALVVVGALGQFFARLIKAGISRQREFLADASALQYTREPDGLVGAFLKIAGVPGQGRLVAPEAEEISHMLFEDGIGFSGWMATHPPLLDRIRAIRPGFKPAKLDDAYARQSMAPPSGVDEDRALGLAPAAPLPTADHRVVASPSAIAAAGGQCQRADHDRALAVLGALPEVVERAARDREDALPLLYGLLLSKNAAVRRKQQAEMAARAPAAVVGQAQDFADRLEELHAALRLPLAELALASLKRRSRSELHAIADVCFALVHADGHVSLFEYALASRLRQELEAFIDPRAPWRRPHRRLVDLETDVVAVLAAMAHAGHASTADAQRAFMAGLQRVLPKSTARYVPPSGGLAALDDAWPRLDDLVPKAKVLLIEGLSAAAAHDGHLAVAEAELLRLVATLLEAPLPAALAPPEERR